MIKVSGLPVNITKCDLDELFSPYGTIQITENSVVLKIQQIESIAHLELDKNEQLAIQELNNTKWRDKYTLLVAPIRRDELEIRQPGGGRTTTKKFRLKEKMPEGGGPDDRGQPGGGGTPNPRGGQSGGGGNSNK
ncbi:hypothetical protein D0A34_14175 [Microcoleus vaginatus PCC 9802]|uniref:hypothetical protein n=1 Tax=Microcoleus vaginatus TaxID=119532 RepID=UPI00020D2970|nr:hypothetical protein MicvaDRAFT_4113 [Microcoleus vaginatus FGP-2]UNU19867.1 hypothetical protein D0A34_14175 [Microcoleus vaginatus PCC 9802]